LDHEFSVAQIARHHFLLIGCYETPRAETGLSLHIAPMAPKRTNRTYAAVVNAHAEIARMCSIARLASQYISPNRSF
jgi:hypothetical protein